MTGPPLKPETGIGVGVVYGGGGGSWGGGGREGREEAQGRKKSLGLWRYGLNVYICLPLSPQPCTNSYVESYAQGGY